MPVKKSNWGSGLLDKCPNCNERLRIYVQSKIWTTKISGYKTKARKKKT